MRYMQPRISRLLVLVTGLFVQSPQAHAITAGQIDDFQDGTTQSWKGGPTTTNAPDSGPNGVGDHALSVPSSGGSFAGSRLVTFNDPNSSAWTGDWTANGVTQIQLDVFNPNAFALTMRLGIAGPGDFGNFGLGNKYVTSTGIVVPAHGHWHTILFDVTAADLTQITGTDAAVALTGVTQFRVIHNSALDWRGEAVAGTFLLDNITAIPEPATATLGLGSLAMALLTRRQRRHLV